MSMPLIRRRTQVLPTYDRRSQAVLRSIVVDRSITRRAARTWRSSLSVVIAGAVVFGICVYGIAIVVYAFATR